MPALIEVIEAINNEQVHWSITVPQCVKKIIM